MPVEHLCVVLVTRHLLLGSTLALSLEEDASLAVTVLHPDDLALRARCAELGADVVVIEMEGAEGWRTAVTELAELPGCRVLAMGRQADIGSVAEAMGSGARGYVTVDDSLERLRDAIHDLAAGGVALPRLTPDAPDPAPAGRPTAPQRLTPREMQVLRLLVDGQTTAQIAEASGVSLNTARTHVQNILTKLGVHSRLEAAAYAARHGLVEDGS